MAPVCCNRVDSLPREHCKAFEFMLEKLKTSEVQPDTEISPGIILQNQYQFIVSSVPSKNIPSRGEWRWHQARSRKTVVLPEATITFFKLTPRNRKRQCTAQDKVHGFKLWNFYIVPSNKFNLPMSFLWCEKGYQACNIEPEIQLSDFSFLAPFMSDKLAHHLWPNMDQCL